MSKKSKKPVKKLDNSPHPTMDHSPHPTLDHSPHPTLDHSPHPTLDHSPHPTLEHSPHPTLDYSPHPTLDHSPHPTLDHSPHPILDHSPHPTLDNSSHPTLDNSPHRTLSNTLPVQNIIPEKTYNNNVVNKDTENVPEIKPGELVHVVEPAEFAPVVELAEFAPVVKLAEFAPVVELAEFTPVVESAEVAPVVGPAEFAPVVELVGNVSAHLPTSLIRHTDDILSSGPDVVSTEPASVDTEPAAVDTEPTAVDTEPTAVDTEPTAVDTEPAAVDIEPAAVDTEPAAVDTEPAAFDTEPATVDTEPASVDTEPAAVDTEPAAVDTEPAAVDTEPAAVDTEPAAVDTEPAAVDSTQSGKGSGFPVDGDIHSNTPRDEQGTGNIDELTDSDTAQHYTEQGYLMSSECSMEPNCGYSTITRSEGEEEGLVTRGFHNLAPQFCELQALIPPFFQNIPLNGAQCVIPVHSQAPDNLNETRAETSSESECEAESRPPPPYQDPHFFVPKLDLNSLAGHHSDSASSSARSESMEYLKNVFGPPSPYPFINPLNPYYMYQIPPPQFFSPHTVDPGRVDGIVRPTAQYTPQFTLPFHTLHSPTSPPGTKPTKTATSKRKLNPKSGAAKRPRVVVEKKAPEKRTISCNFQQNGPACDEEFSDSQQLVCHIANIHNVELDHVCRNCKKFSLRKLSLWRRKIENEKFKNKYGVYCGI